MKTLPYLAAWLAVSPLALAQHGNETLGVFFDASASQTSIQVAPFEPFQLFVVADEIPVGLGAYEFELSLSPQLVILSSIAHPQSTSVDVDPSAEGFIVGTGACLWGPGPIVVTELSCMALGAGGGMSIQLGPATPSSFGGTSTGYAQWGNLELYPFIDSNPAGLNVDVQFPGSFCSCDQPANAPCGNAGVLGSGCANSASASGASLFASGSPSAASSSLVLHATSLPPSKPGLFFQGTTQVGGGAGAPFGDGLRCAGGSVTRLQVRISDAAGAVNSSIDLGVAGGVQSGDIRYYQLWYRDLISGPCGSTFNTTNALEVTWAN